MSARHKGGMESTVTLLAFPDVILPGSPVSLVDLWCVSY